MTETAECRSVADKPETEHCMAKTQMTTTTIIGDDEYRVPHSPSRRVMAEDAMRQHIAAGRRPAGNVFIADFDAWVLVRL